MFKGTSFLCLYSIFFMLYIFMLYMLIHTVLAVVEFVVVLWNRVYNLCTLYVLKGEDRAKSEVMRT